MMGTNALLKQGIAALKAGQKAEARRLLAQVVQQDKDNETAWLWLSGAVDTDRERIHCLRETLRINPNNQHARRGLEELESKVSTLRPVQPTEKKPIRPLGIQSPPTREEKKHDAEPIQVAEKPPDDTKQCPHCAETIKAEAKFCRFCGRNLEMSELPQQLQAQSQQPKTAMQQAAPPRKKRNPIITCLAALGLITVVFICLGLLISPSSTTSRATKTPIAPRPTSTPRRVFELLDFRWHHDGIGNAILEGTIKNVGGSDLRFVELRGTVYDKSGGIVNTHCSYIDSDILYKGASSTFTIYVDDPNDVGVRARVEVESYREY